MSYNSKIDDYLFKTVIMMVYFIDLSKYRVYILIELKPTLLSPNLQVEKRDFYTVTRAHGHVDLTSLLKLGRN